MILYAICYLANGNMLLARIYSHLGLYFSANAIPKVINFNSLNTKTVDTDHSKCLTIDV